MKLPFILCKNGKNPLKMGPKNPLILQKSKLSQKENLHKMVENTIESEKHEETVENRPIGGQRNNTKEPSDLADQWSRSDWHITIGGDRRKLSGGNHITIVIAISRVNEDRRSSAQIDGPS